MKQEAQVTENTRKQTEGGNLCSKCHERITVVCCVFGLQMRAD